MTFHPSPSDACTAPRRSPGSASRPRSSPSRSAGTCGSACPTATSRSCSPSAASRSTTSRSTGGSSGSPRSSSRRPVPPARRRGSLARRRDLREGRRVALPVPGHRPVRPGHRRVPLAPTRRRGRSAVLRSGLDADLTRRGHHRPVPALPPVLDELAPSAFHRTDLHANNSLEADHGRLKARLRPMRGLKRDRTARVIVAGHAFVQNLRRGFYDLGVNVPRRQRLAEVAWLSSPRSLISPWWTGGVGRPGYSQCNNARRPSTTSA